MKPPKFEYIRVDSIEQALAALDASDGNAKILAGGQSLMPMLNFRIVYPSMLIDINRVPNLDDIEETGGGGLRIGALVRHRKLESSALVKRRFPILTAAVEHVGHLAIRNRGTLGGSLAHADPAAELPFIAVLLDASISVVSSKGPRQVAISDLIAGALSTTLAHNEIITGVSLPGLGGKIGWGFEEYSRRSGDFALVAAAVLMQVENAKVADARIAVAGGVNGPVRARDAESALRNRPCDDAALKAVIEEALKIFEPNSDLHASAELRRHLAGVLLGRAAKTAWRRAGGLDI